MVLNNATDIRLCSTQVSAVYLGSNLVWPTTPPSPSYDSQYLTIELIDDGKITYGAPSSSSTNELQYSTDNGATWTSLHGYETDRADRSTPVFNAGTKVLLKGTNLTIYQTYGIGNIEIWRTVDSTEVRSRCNVYGNIMSLLFGDNFTSQTSLSGYDYAFSFLFGETGVVNNRIIDASNLILPATTLSSYCYYGMFFNCRSLTTAPALPATTLATRCYYDMFEGCSSLQSAPELPAPTLVQGCYERMFRDCSSLTYIKCLATTNIGILSNTTYWVENVNNVSSGVFVYAYDAAQLWSRGVHGVPSEWTMRVAT